jgi:hypothetical protein
MFFEQESGKYNFFAFQNILIAIAVSVCTVVKKHILLA